MNYENLNLCVPDSYRRYFSKQNILKLAFYIEIIQI